MLGAVLLSTINLAYYQALMAGMREAIAAGRFADFQAATKAQWAAGGYCRQCEMSVRGCQRCVALAKANP